MSTVDATPLVLIIDDEPEMQASNSWFVEGLAGYMEPSPVGGINSERLAEVQEAKRAKPLLPLMIHEHPADQGVELAWFTEAIGKDQQTLDEEFAAYLEQFPPEDSLLVKQMKTFLDLRDELTTLYHRYGG